MGELFAGVGRVWILKSMVSSDGTLNLSKCSQRGLESLSTQNELSNILSDLEGRTDS